MRASGVFLIVALGIGLSGCARKPKTNNLPPAPPKPVVSPTPAPPPEPLSIPQTNVHLPPPQPLTPEAIATTQPAGPATPPPATPRPQPRPPRPRPAEPPAVSVPPSAPPPNVEAGRGPYTEVLPPAESKRLQDEATGRVNEARRLIQQLPAARRRGDSRVRRIETFLKQAEDAERRGDLRQANELAGRALVLARELRP